MKIFSGFASTWYIYLFWPQASLALQLQRRRHRARRTYANVVDDGTIRPIYLGYTQACYRRK